MNDLAEVPHDACLKCGEDLYRDQQHFNGFGRCLDWENVNIERGPEFHGRFTQLGKINGEFPKVRSKGDVQRVYDHFNRLADRGIGEHSKARYIA